MNATHGKPQKMKQKRDSAPAMMNSSDAGPANSCEWYESTPCHQKKPAISQKT